MLWKALLSIAKYLVSSVLTLCEGKRFRKHMLKFDYFEKSTASAAKWNDRGETCLPNSSIFKRKMSVSSKWFLSVHPPVNAVHLVWEEQHMVKCVQLFWPTLNGVYRWSGALVFLHNRAKQTTINHQYLLLLHFKSYLENAVQFRNWFSSKTVVTHLQYSRTI